MGYTNPKQVLVDIAKYPAAIEAKLPAQLPRITSTLIDTANKLPALPDFPMEVPDLPAPPEIPEAPGELRRLGARRRYVTGATVVPVGAAPTPTPTREIIPSPAAGVLPEVVSRRGM